jgi:hypothetical protein
MPHHAGHGACWSIKCNVIVIRTVILIDSASAGSIRPTTFKNNVVKLYLRVKHVLVASARFK